MSGRGSKGGDGDEDEGRGELVWRCNEVQSCWCWRLCWTWRARAWW